ncbi:MAG: hypothetical protein GDA66_10930 [Nitrospira sp. CR1.2]|nr:hypothetical protein [Nitrospira sp. CR1.2]
MYAVLVIVLLLLPIALALSWPMTLICVSLLTGAAPVTLGRGEQLAGDLGRLDLYAIRLLGLWVAAFVVCFLHVGKVISLIVRFRFHALFLVFAVLTLMWAPSLLYGSRMLAKLTAPFLFMLMVLVVVSTHAHVRRIETVLLATGVLAVAVELGTWLSGYRFEGKVGLGIPGLGPAASSAHLAVLSIFAFALYRYSRSAMHFTLMVGFAVAAAAGFTRITIVGLFVGFSSVLFVSSRGFTKYVLPSITIAALPASFLFSDTLRYRMFKGGHIPSLDTIAHDPSSTFDYVHGSGRFDAWSYVIEHFFLPNPWLGAGAGTTQHYFYTHPAIGLNAIHSEYVRILAELGLVGFAIFAMMVISYVLSLRQVLTVSTDALTKRTTAGAIGALLFYIVFMATDNAIDYVTSCGIFVFAMIAISQRSYDLEGVAGFKVAERVSARATTQFYDGQVIKSIERFPILPR